MVLSVVAMSGAFAATAVADEHDINATLSQESYEEVGDQVTVELDLSPASGDQIEFEGGAAVIDYDETSLEFVEAEDHGTDFSFGDTDDDQVVISYIGENEGDTFTFTDESSVSITFEVIDEVDESHLTFAESSFFGNQDDELSVEWSDGKIYSGDGENWWDPYTDENGVADVFGVLDAIENYQSGGDIGVFQVLDLIESYQTSTPMDQLE